MKNARCSCGEYFSQMFFIIDINILCPGTKNISIFHYIPCFVKNRMGAPICSLIWDSQSRGSCIVINRLLENLFWCTSTNK